MSDMLNGLDLFSGIGGISIALSEWVRPVAYCEIDPYCRGVLLSGISDKSIPRPIIGIWDDIRTFDGSLFKGSIDIMYGGFPCQDISVAGHGKGLAGERSGLYWQIHRLAKEIFPKFIFLENVPAICTRGGWEVVSSLAEMGYDSRWCVISAASVGAPHKRDRWFMLAHSPSIGCDKRPSEGIHSEWETGQHEESGNNSGKITNAECSRLERQRERTICAESEQSLPSSLCIQSYWEEIEPPICGVDDGIPNRAHRIKSLGNAVVPQQAKKAFEILMGVRNG